ncbi:YadA-like family protein [Veillonella atypica]|nr:YadA-like family protein [Veillonella atypica]MDE8713921.1 YadA-like family protein [Veillonella atypica]
MNKIFKVIWSKSKQCYVVVSEMAKNTTGKKKIIVASILAGLAMSTMGPNVMAVSPIPFTDKPSSALGNGSVKPGTTNGVAIGNAAYSDSHQSIAIGFRSLASGTFLGGSIKPSVAVGAGAHAEGNNTVAIGTVAENRASYGVSLGNESRVTSGSDYGIAIGYQTQVSAVHSMAIGEKANASATLAIALGANAKATGAYSYTAGFNSASGGEAAIAVGKSASAGGESAVAVGNGTVATAGDAVAIGTSSQATGGDSIALGKNANASNGDSIAIGQDTVSNQINSVALGKSSQATGGSATALGPQAKATGSTAVAIGLNSEANTSATVAIGQSSAASGLQAIAVGYKSAASGDNAAAYGNTAKAVGKNSLALGANTQATVEGGVALGAGSIANTVAGAGYNPNTGRTNTFTGLSGNALTSTWAAVSIGDGTNTRQLTGLAAGTNNTDAVNVAQLKSMNLAFTADGSTKGDVNLTNSALNVVGDSTYITTKGNNQTLTISGKKQNITVTNGTASASAGMADANNVAQAINQANADQTISYKANNGTANTVKVSDGLNFTNGTSTVATVGANGQVTYDLNSTTKQSITDSSTAVNRTIALGSDSGSTTAKKLSTSAIAFNIKGDTGANALITTTATGDNVSITPTAKLTAAVAAAENAANKNLSNISSSGETVIKNLAKGAAQDAVKVASTGLATVSDNTVGGVKTYTVDVNTGNLVVAANGQVGAAGTTGASGAAGSNGVATTQNVATAINDAVTKAKASTTQALADAEHKFAGDTGNTSVRKHGEVLTIKGGVTNAASLTTGNIGVVSDGAGTLNVQLAKVLSGLTSATFTTAGGNTTVINSDGLTITPSGAGASAISMTTDGINAGGKEVKGIADGTAADSAVSKGQMETAIANAQTAATSTEKVVAKTLSGDTNLATVTGQTGTSKGETYEVAVSENVVKNVAKAAAQDAVTVTGTGLATVSDNTAAGVKTYTVNVDEGKLVIDDTTGKVGAAGSTQGTTAGKNGVATTQNVATAINDAITKSNVNTAQALADAKHNFAGDDATVISRKHGEQLNIKGGASTTATDLTSGNIAVVGDTTTGTLNIKMAKALTGLTSATYTDGAGNTQTVTGGSSTISDAAGHSTVVSKGGVTTTDGTNTTTVAPSGITATDGTHTVTLGGSGINAGGAEVKNVGKATTDDAAVNKKQMDDAVKAATDSISTLGDNKVSLGSDSGTTTAKKLSTTGGIKFNIKGENGANALITTSATGDDVTIAPTAKLTAAVTAAEKSADKDLSNLSAAGDTYIKNLAKTAASWNVETNGAGTTAVAGGESVNFINGDNIAITNAGRAITIGTAKNVAFDKVTVGGVVLDKTDGINAGGKEVKGIADGTAADSAVSKGQMETAIANAQTAATSTEKVIAKTLTGDTNLATVTGQTGTAKGETYEVAVSENAVKNVAKAAAQDAVTVTGTGLATVSDNTTGGVKTYTVNVDEGKLVLDDTTGKIGANGATQGTTAGKNGVATTQNVATAINDAVTKANANNAQALADAKHNFAGDDATVISRKHGEQLNIKGGASTTATDLTSGNIAVVGDTASGTLNIKMAKALTGLTSATFTDGSGNTQTVTGASSTITDGAGNTTAITKGGVTTTDAAGNTTTTAPTGVTVTPAGAGATPISVTTSGISAGNKEIKNIANGTTDDAAVNKKQMDDAVKAATDATTALGNNTIALGSDAGSTTAKKLSTSAITFNIKGDTGANALITTSATGDDVTIAPTAKLTAAVTAAEKSADKDLSNISSAGKTVIKDLAVTSAQDAVNVTGTGLATVSDNTTGGVKTYTVNVDEGKLVLDDTTGKIGANGSTQGTTAGKNGVATTQNVATAINDAITKSNANTAQALADAEHKFDGDTGTTSVRKHGEVLSIKGGVTTPADLATGNIGVVSDGAGTLNIRLAKVLSGLTSATFKDASGNTTMVTGGSTTIADTAGNTQTLAPTKSEIKDNNGVSTVTTKDGVTAKDASGQTTSLTKGGVNATDGNGNTTSLTNTGVSATDGNGHTTGLTNGGLSTTDGTNTTTVAPTGITATDGTNTVKLNGSGIDAGNTQIKNVGKATTDDAAVNKKQMDDAVKSATDATTALGNNTIALGSDAGSTTAKKLSTNAITFNIKGDTGANALITTSATGDNVTIAPTAKLTAAVTAAEKSADKDLSNISSAGKTVIKDLAVTSAQDAVNVTGTGLATVSDNTTGGVKTYTVNVDEGKLVLDDTTGKIGANGSTQGTTAGKNGVATTQNVATAINDAITKSNANTAQALADAEHKFDGDTGTTSVRKHGEVLSIKGGVTTPADLTTGNIGVVSDGAGTLNIRLAKVLSGLTSATFKDASGNTTMVTGGSTTIADTAGNTQTLAPTKSEIKDTNGVSTVTTKDGVTAKDASGQMTSLTKGGVNATDGNGNTTSLTNTGVSATDGNGHTTGLTNGGLSTTDGTNTTTVVPTGITATDGTNTVKLNGSGIDAGNTEIKNVGKATTDDAAVNKKQMDDAITKATADATHEFGGDDATVVSRKHGEKLTIKGGASTNAADLTSGNIAVIGDANGALNIKLAKALTGLTSATYTDTAGNTTTVTGGSTTIADTSGNTQTLAPTKSEIKDNNGVSTVTTKDGVTAKDASGQTTSLTKGGVNATDGNGNTTSLTNTGVSATDGNGHTTGLTNGGLSTTDGTNTTTVAPTGMTATDGTNTVKVEGSGIDAGGTQIKNVGKATTDDAAVNKKQMDDAITKATADATHEFAGDTGSNSVRKHGEVLSIKGGVTDTNKLSDNNIGVISDGAGTLNVKLSKDLTGLTSATFKDGSGNTQTVTGASSTITDGTGNTTTITKGGVTTTDAAGNTTTTAPTGVTVTPAGAGATPISVTTSGISAGNKEIKNVANGTTDDAAVNKKQMDDAVKAATDATTALGNNTIAFGGDSGSTTAKKLSTANGIKFNIKGDTGTNALITTSATGDDVTITPTDKLTNAVTAAEKSADKDLSNLSAAGNTHIQDLAKSAASWNVQTNGKDTTAVVGGDTVNFINGDNIAITNTGHAITIGTAKNVSFDKVTVGGMTLDKNGILSGISSITGSGTGAPTMTFNSQNGNTPANVSINSNLDMGGHRITGVGPAEKPTDAVNKQQVDQALRGLAGLADNAARQYASKAGANAAALAALKPIQYDPLEPTQIMAGVGNYKSQTAVALGMAHYTNENTMFNIGVSLDSHDNMVNAGVTHKFGYSPEKKAIPDRYKGGPISSIYVMQDEMQALLAKDQEKDAVISKQASEIDTLRQQNEDMQRKIDMILAKLQ